MTMDPLKGSTTHAHSPGLQSRRGLRLLCPLLVSATAFPTPLHGLGPHLPRCPSTTKKIQVQGVVQVLVGGAGVQPGGSLPLCLPASLPPCPGPSPALAQPIFLCLPGVFSHSSRQLLREARCLLFIYMGITGDQESALK